METVVVAARRRWTRASMTARDKKASSETAERYNYKIDLIAERLTNRTTENFDSPEMKWGRLYEEEAVFAYEKETNTFAHAVGFILHPIYDWAGSSPDSLVGSDGGLEIKCPKTATHLKWMREGVVPEDHQPQVLFNMLCAEREWWDFASYDPRLPDGLRLFIVRMHRDEERIKQIEAEVIKFNEEVEEVIAELRQRVKVTPVEPTPELEDWPARFSEFTGMDEVCP
jgi:hypothetical protein